MARVSSLVTRKIVSLVMSKHRMGMENHSSSSLGSLPGPRGTDSRQFRPVKMTQAQPKRQSHRMQWKRVLYVHVWFVFAASCAVPSFWGPFSALTREWFARPFLSRLHHWPDTIAPWPYPVWHKEVIDSLCELGQAISSQRWFVCCLTISIEKQPTYKFDKPHHSAVFVNSINNGWYDHRFLNLWLGPWMTA